MNTSRFFAHYYNNAEVNSIMIMDLDGNVLDVNRAFTANFGYSNDDIQGENFSLLFNEPDKETGKPQLELDTVAAKGQFHDSNYIMNKEGEAIWCTGEALLVESEEGEKYIVKDVVNLQAKKQVQLFLNDTEELLEHIFLYSKEVPMMILDGRLKIQRVNAAFLRLFELKEAPAEESRIAEIPHPFWENEEILTELRQMLVKNTPLKAREFVINTQTGEKKAIRLNSKIINRRYGLNRTIFVIIEEV